jgi:hypothetical protein
MLPCGQVVSGGLLIDLKPETEYFQLAPDRWAKAHVKPSLFQVNGT